MTGLSPPRLAYATRHGRNVVSPALCPCHAIPLAITPWGPEESIYAFEWFCRCTRTRVQVVQFAAELPDVEALRVAALLDPAVMGHA